MSLPDYAMEIANKHLRRRRGAWALLLCLLIVGPLLAACTGSQVQPPLKVVATLAPLADWARQVGGDQVQVTQIVPAGIEPASYALTEQNKQAIADADVLIFNGFNLEPWLATIDRNVQSSLVMLDMSQYLGMRDTGTRTVVRTPLEGESGNKTEAQPVYFPPSIVSPYIWLDPGPTMAQRATVLIADTFTRADPDNVLVYRRNAEQYNGELENLDNWIKRQIRSWPRVRVGGKNILAMQTLDRSWHYFAQHYTINLRTTATINTFLPTIPGATPLFTDWSLSHSEQLRQIGLRKPDGVLNPLSHQSYIQLMQENVKVMTEGMQRAAKNEPKQFSFSVADS